LYRVHFPTENFLSHNIDVVSRTFRHGKTSCHIIVQLYRVHFATNKLLIKS